MFAGSPVGVLVCAEDRRELLRVDDTLQVTVYEPGLSCLAPQAALDAGERTRETDEDNSQGPGPRRRRRRAGRSFAFPSLSQVMLPVPYCRFM
jgi:hypothetical protein